MVVLQGREKVLGSLRKELHIGNDAHAEIMDCVLNGKVPPRLAAAEAVRSVLLCCLSSAKPAETLCGVSNHPERLAETVGLAKWTCP